MIIIKRQIFIHSGDKIIDINYHRSTKQMSILNSPSNCVAKNKYNGWEDVSDRCIQNKRYNPGVRF